MYPAYVAGTEYLSYIGDLNTLILVNVVKGNIDPNDPFARYMFIEFPFIINIISFFYTLY